MKIKALLCAVAATVAALSLCGCSLLATDTVELLSPPEPSGDMRPIEQALKSSVGGEYTLKYPSGGDRRSAVILEDINGDNTFEAFAFYSTSSDNVTYMNVNLIVSDNGEWRSVASRSIVAGGIERVDFCDLDGDGTKELLVGWEIYGETEKQLAVYSWGKEGLSQRMLQRYSSFLCCDLDENEEYEVFIHNLDTASGINSASLFKLWEGGVSEIAGCLMDKTVKTAEEPVLSTLSSGQPAIYIDEVKGAGAVTEILFLSQDTLVNNLLDSSVAENTQTLRTSSILSKDINLDGIIEVPVSRELPSVYSLDNGEKLYYTSWCSFNGEYLTEKMLTVMNINDGYYLAVPAKWINRIAVSRDTDNSSRTVYEYYPETGAVGEMVAYFQVVAADKWDSGVYRDKNYVEVCRRDGEVFVAWGCDAHGSLALTEDELKSVLRLLD